ncbi:DUF305 domain-containing protein [Rubrobacter tropicus]|uniref:DUF305 domain-containing protein n=1 Tax=Rubrobacter tropicus TaxID=2653851 RepID=A0A6G8QD62_9ACTN|nr:DUF305 domain-containing protein [Rubrobacter tropicus]QIN84435.1 DUF305 domain-containing protein [Rubrobacter tropicus]
MTAKYLVPVLAVLAILLAGIGTVYADGRPSAWGGQSMMGGQSTGYGSGMVNGSDSMMGHMMNGPGTFSGPRPENLDKSQPFDLRFIDEMIMHHQMAIVSSEHMISDSDRPELRKLADDIQKSQSDQIGQMREWRQRWYPDAGPAYGTTGGTMNSGMMEGMAGGSMQESMGADVADEMFLRMMIPHHEQAIEMSEQALDKAEHPEIQGLAKKIIDEQSAEIKLMQGYLEEIERAESQG